MDSLVCRSASIASRLTFDGYAVVRELVYAPWVGRDGKIKRAFRAEVIAEASPSGKPAQAA